MLLQIEEPGSSREEIEDPGLAIGLDLGADALAVAIAIGGNVEVLRGGPGGAFMAAVLGYDGDGDPVAGADALALPPGEAAEIALRL